MDVEPVFVVAKKTNLFLKSIIILQITFYTSNMITVILVSKPILVFLYVLG
jgi:hypothetical protein